MSQNKTNFAVPLAFVGMMFFAIGFALGINSFLIPVLKGALSLPSGVAYLLLAATFVPFLIFGYPASATIAKIGYKRTMALSFLIFAVAFILFVLSAKLENFILFLIASFVSGAANAYLQASVNPYITILGPIESGYLQQTGMAGSSFVFRTRGSRPNQCADFRSVSAFLHHHRRISIVRYHLFNGSASRSKSCRRRRIGYRQLPVCSK